MNSAPSPASAPSLRANPSSEGTDLVCRLPLPTLIYRLEAVHLGDLLRIWVRSGATPPRSPRTDFQGPGGSSPDAAPCWRRSSHKSQNPLSLQEVSRASAAFGEKITLPEAPAGVSVSCRVTATNLVVQRATPPGVRSPKGHRFRSRVPEFWPDSLSPFMRWSLWLEELKPPPLHLGFPLGLRID